MRLISIKTLKPGDKIVVSVYTQNGSKFMAEGVEASDFIIERLRQMGVEYTFIDDERFPDIVYKELISVKTAVDVVKVLKQTLDSIQKGKNINEEAVKEAAKAIAEETRKIEIPISIINASYVIEDPCVAHAIRTAIISVAMGVNIGYNFGQLCDVGLAGLMHDCGRDNCTGEEDSEHTAKGFEILRKYKLLNLNSSIVAYQHHENFDGSGFPRRLKGLDISEFSRIVSVADYFDTLISGGIASMIDFKTAYEKITDNIDKMFDPMMVRAFGHAIQIYNTGTIVALNNGKKGIVVSQNPGFPLRPNVRLFWDELPGIFDEINLSQFRNHEISIQSIII